MTPSDHHSPSAYRPVVTALVIAFLAALALLLTSAPSARADTAPGLVLTGNWFQSDNNFQAVSDSGTQWVRAFLYWSDIEHSKGTYNKTTLGYYDKAIARLPAGVKVLLVVVGTPAWANAGAGQTVPPTNNQDYADFVHFLAGRFAGHVQAYEIWNEEDLNIWWDAPNASRYVALLKPAYAAIKSADPAATVVLGGLTGNDYQFLQRIYDAGGKGSFDVVSDHTDTACGVASPESYIRDQSGLMDQDSFLSYREVAKVIAANEGVATDSSGLPQSLPTPIWLTEFGWAVSPKLCDAGAFAGKKAGGVTDAQQQQYMLQAFHCMATDKLVQVAFWFSLQDYPTPNDSPQGDYGLERLDGSRRPSFAGFSDYAHNGDRLTEACGNFTGPTVGFTSPDPTRRQSKKNTLHIDVAAHSPAGVVHIALYWNVADPAHRIGLKAAQISQVDPSTMRAQIDWFGWRHDTVSRLIAVASDPQGNTTSQTDVVSAAGNAAGSKHAKSRRKHAKPRSKHPKRHPKRRRHP
jgi:Cellulase (glycosyl hydrolase family 5)